MRSRISLLLILFGLFIPVIQAQDGTPSAVLEAAQSAAEAELGERAESWRWSILSGTRSSTLGCPLVEPNQDLPQEVTPYRMELIYSDGIYVVHVSQDGAVVQLCDAKFSSIDGDPSDGDADENTTGDQQTTTTDPCVLTITSEGVAYLVPSFDQQAMFRFTPGETYTPFGLTDNRLWFRAQQGAAVGWINVASAEQSAGCANFEPTLTVAPGGEPCFVTPIGTFANVRTRPDENSDLAGVFNENQVSQATGRNTNGDWYFMEAGWVSTTVVNLLGTCSGVLVNDGLIGQGFPDAASEPEDTSVSTALQEFACPPNFEGYLAPRISIGRSTARIDDGGFPNTLRTYPTTNDVIGERIGSIQPGRTLDRVINGPVCNLGFVWWYIEFDGQQGWTAESSFTDEDYFIVPTGDAATVAVPPSVTPLPTNTPLPAPTQVVQQVATAAPTATSSTTTITPENIVLQQDDNPLIAVAFNNVAGRAADAKVFTAATTPGFGDALAGVVQAWRLIDLIPTEALAVPSGIIDIAYLPTANQLVVAAGNGTLSFYDATNLSEVSVLNDLFAQPSNAGFAFSPDESQFTITDCTDETCTTGIIQTYDAQTGELLWQTEQTGHIPAKNIRYNAQGNLIATVAADGVRSWSAESGDSTSYYAIEANTRPTDLLFANEAGTQYLLVGCNLASDTDDCESGRIELVETNTATSLGQIQGIDSAITSGAIQSNFARAAFAQADGSVRIINTATGETLDTLAITGSISEVTYNTDDSVLAVASDDGSLTLFESGQ